MSTIRARFTRGRLKPLERLDLPEGSEVTVTILAPSSVSDRSAFRRAAGAWKGTLDASALIRRIYHDRLVSTRAIPRL
jgi:predicted DNA-binding antitoxin AbrB/MazE fold protein